MGRIGVCWCVAAAIRKRRVHHLSFSLWRWHLDEVFVRINGETHYLWRAVDHEGEVLEAFATERRDRRAALKFLKRTMKRHGRGMLVPRAPARCHPGNKETRSTLLKKLKWVIPD